METDVSEEPIANGRYTASLKPINVTLGRFTGWLKLSITDNQFWARVKVNGPQTTQMHAQYIHSGSVCPDMKDDLNRDGYLDFMEVYKIAGPILLPLDSNLNAQLKGLNEFPVMRKNSGLYYYSESCNSERLMADLKRTDIFPYDMITKLHPSEKIDLTKRIIIIYGVSADRNLPESVSSFDGYPREATMPVACGEITVGE